jgi:hypothetical protein
MGELDHWKTIDLDNRQQTRRCGKYRINWILKQPTPVKLRNRACREVESKKPREFIDTEWAGSDCDTLEKAVGDLPICFIDIS